MDQYVKVVNTSFEVLAIPWNKGFLNTRERAEYEAFKQTPDYLGISDADKAARKKMPEAIKAYPFFERMDRGVYFDEYNVGGTGVTEIRRKLRWVLGPDIKALAKDPLALYKVRDLMQKNKMGFKASDSVEDMLAKIEAKFGKNWAVLTKTQLRESGLSGLVKKEIIQRNSKTPTSIIWEGFLEVTDITPEQAKELGEDIDIEEVSELSVADLPYEELRAMAKARGISDYNKKTKLELIQLLSV